MPGAKHVGDHASPSHCLLWLSELPIPATGQSRAARMLRAAASGEVKAPLFSPGKNLARVAVGMGGGDKIMTRGPVRAVSAAQHLASEIWAAFVAP